MHNGRRLVARDEPDRRPRPRRLSSLLGADPSAGPRARAGHTEQRDALQRRPALPAGAPARARRRVGVRRAGRRDARAAGRRRPPPCDARPDRQADLSAPASARAPSAQPLLRRARSRGAGLQARAIGARAAGGQATRSPRTDEGRAPRARGGSQVGDRRRPFGPGVARRAGAEPPHLALPPRTRLPRGDRVHARRVPAGAPAARCPRAAARNRPRLERAGARAGLLEPQPLHGKLHPRVRGSTVSGQGPATSPRTARRGLAGLASTAVRVGAVDLGTNSTRLLVADVDDGRVEEVARLSEITRLGEDVDNRRKLLPLPVARVRNVLSDYRRELERIGAERVLTIGTSAVRDAENGEAFLGEIEWSYGFTTRLLTGEEEAELTLRGVGAVDDGTVVIDIGGGSTELISSRSRVSTDLGSVRLTERFLGSDPPTSSELE